MSEPTWSRSEVRGEQPVNEMRASLYERVMAAQEQIAHALYARGMSHESVLAALDAADAGITAAERREDLYLSSLSVYVQALGGQLEISAVFGDARIAVRRDPLPTLATRRPAA